MQKAEQQVTMKIDTTPEKVWAVIGTGTGVNMWFSELVNSCELQGTTRVCGTAHGDLIEEILKIDHENREFKYGFIQQNMVPDIENLIGSMKILADDEGMAVINWRWTFNAKDSNSAKQAQEAFKGAGSIGIKGLESYIQGLGN